MDAGVVWAKGLFISEVSYTIIICSIKFSLLAFYWRIFKQSKIRVPIYILGAIVSCWGIAVVSATSPFVLCFLAYSFLDSRDRVAVSTSKQLLEQIRTRCERTFPL